MGFDHIEEGPKVVLIVPITFDLQVSAKRGVLLGRGTKRACREAAREALRERRRKNGPSIFVSATRAPLEYNHVFVADLMARFIRRLVSSGVPVEVGNSKEFNTAGEVLAVADFIIANSLQDARVVFCVKDWHAPRLRRLVSIIFAKRGIDPCVEYKTHKFPCGLSWFIHEIGGRLLVRRSAQSVLNRDEPIWNV